MTHIATNQDAFLSLRGRTVVITGAATGIGRAAAIQFHNYGANVVLGDVAEDAGRTLQKSLETRSLFVSCNTASYSDQLSLFATAFETYGSVDVVVANAAVVDYHDPFGPVEDITSEPAFRELDINLRGVMFTARIGMHYLRKSGGGDLIMTSSIGGFKETAHLTPYLASKHGVIGVMRGLRLTTLADSIRVNVVCPWMTRTAMTKGIEKGWLELHLPVNEPEDVARSMLICATVNRAPTESRHKGAKLPFHGKIVFAAGGESFEIEDNLQSLEPEWLGTENSRQLAIGQQYLHSGDTSWKS